MKANADVELVLAAPEKLDNFCGCLHRTLSIMMVFVEAPDGHDAVAHVFVNDPAVALDLMAADFKKITEQQGCSLGAHAL